MRGQRCVHAQQTRFMFVSYFCAMHCEFMTCNKDANEKRGEPNDNAETLIFRANNRFFFRNISLFLDILLKSIEFWIQYDGFQMNDGKSAIHNYTLQLN